MGGKRELHHCMTLTDNDNKLTVCQRSPPPAKNVQQHLNAVRPIRIEINGNCQDSDQQDNAAQKNAKDTGRSRSELPVVTCPVTIHINHCSDDEDDGEAGPENSHPIRTSENYHVTNKQSRHKTRIEPSPFTHSHLHPSPKPSSSQSTSRSSHTFLEVPEHSDMSMLKATAVRLKLRTRTSSFMAWEARWLDKAQAPPKFPVPAAGENGGAEKLTEERKGRINHALQWLKTELKEMQSMDQHLARQLLCLRHDIHQLRLSRSCQQHQELLDDVQSEMEEQEELADLLDLPNTSLSDTPLKQLGVTRLNISARRFSMC